MNRALGGQLGVRSNMAPGVAYGDGGGAVTQLSEGAGSPPFGPAAPSGNTTGPPGYPGVYGGVYPGIGCSPIII